MTDSAPVQAPPLSLLQRMIGMITAPRATYESVVAHPRPFGVLFVCALIIGITATIPQFTEPARQATLDMQVKSVERFTGQAVTPEMYEKFDAQSRNPVTRASNAIAPLIMFPILALILSGLFWVFFNAILGGLASFKQVLAVTAHSYVITALATTLSLPILLYKFSMSMGGPFNLGALVPMLDETSILARFLSGISVFSIWGWIVVAIGLSVLYRRSASAIATTLVILSLVFTFALTAVFGSLFG
jgi:hypothetical protein